ncbi:hypothetical protein EQG63_01005 [Flavobacterium amnicola]|uniref:Uncharacterized protein n=1 Tax=Flavobacterium amnicola TaxID=2506422 RepID=A0A4Q1K4Q4_9FLAO|nr:hypothetical protein [Flavobacterium amnicola]RXR20542.1 hypothetical protein EQG63_01005 [Flavobacterium amnicola]
MTFKKHINVLLAILILVSNVGLAFNVHYCEGKISGISFNYKVEEPCVDEKPTKITSCCAVENSHDSCCSNDKVEIKKTTSENVLVKSFQLDLASYLLVQECRFFQAILLQEVILPSENPSFYCESNAPPLYKLYSQYIFYA